jgi:(2Fe-2S) ferredoxin
MTTNDDLMLANQTSGQEVKHDLYIFICCNRRASGVCCGSDERDDYFDQLKQLINEYKPKLKFKVKLNKSGCLGRCANGPNLVIFPYNVWYKFDCYADLEEIVLEHVLTDSPKDVSKILDKM